MTDSSVIVSKNTRQYGCRKPQYNPYYQCIEDNYLREQSKVIYKSKNGNDTKEFDAVDFIASLASHIPNKCEQMVRYNTQFFI